MLTHKKLSSQCANHISLKFTGRQSARWPNGCVVRVSNKQSGVPAGGLVAHTCIRLIYTQRHRDISRAYKTTTTRADAQEIVQPMRELCFAEIHWTPPSMGVNQPPSQRPTNAVRRSSQRVRLTQKPSKNPIMQPPKPSPSIQHHTRKYRPAKRTATHMHSCQQQ